MPLEHFPAPSATASEDVSRRALLRAGAWATPVVALAIAAPPALAASTDPVRSAAVVFPDPINAASYNAGTLSINDIDIQYAYAQWGLTGAEEAEGPATVSYRIAVLRASDSSEIGSLDGGPIVVAKYASHRESGTIDSVPAGSYILRITVTTVTFSASPLPYNFQAALPQSADSGVVTVS